MERITKQHDGHDGAAASRTAQAKLPQNAARDGAHSHINNSPMMVAQYKKLQSLFGGAAQLKGKEEEPLQGKFATVQRAEEEQALQGKFGIADAVPAYSTGSKIAQLRSDKRVELSAQRHYTDGWGAKYGIQDDATLKSRVPNSVKGDGTINLGIYEYGKRWWYQGKQYKKGKSCTIVYADGEEGWGKSRSKYTSIYHCGPSGEPIVKEV